MPDRAAPAGKAPATETEIEVTPEMIEAGLSELLTFSRARDVYEDKVCEIYRAMVRASLSKK
jgi:hypothetical protein